MRTSCVKGRTTYNLVIDLEFIKLRICFMSQVRWLTLKILILEVLLINNITYQKTITIVPQLINSLLFILDHTHLLFILDNLLIRILNLRICKINNLHRLKLFKLRQKREKRQGQCRLMSVNRLCRGLLHDKINENSEIPPKYGLIFRYNYICIIKQLNPNFEFSQRTKISLLHVKFYCFEKE